MTIKNNRNYVIRKLKNNNPKQPYYLNKSGKNISNQNILNYVKKWRIPPAYPEVKIYLNVNDEKDDCFYASGKDVKGRTQQLYTKYHNEVREKTKYCKILEVGKYYNKIYSKLNKDLIKKRITKEKLISIIILLMIECQFRPGHEKYREKYGSIGLSTLQKKHIVNKTTANTNVFKNSYIKEYDEKKYKLLIKNLEKGYLYIRFIGKKGVCNECFFKNKSVIQELLKLTSKKKNVDDIFVYKSIKVKPEDINNYLREFGGITAKNIRTWDANLEFVKKSRELNEPIADKITHRKKQLKHIVEQVAEKLHHSVAICKKSYLDSSLFEMFVDKPDKFTKMFLNKKHLCDKVLIKYFEKKCKNK